MEIVGMTSDKAIDVVEWIGRNRAWFKCTLEAFMGIKINNNKLFGKTFVISGLLYERDKLSMEAKIRDAGGRVIDNGKNVDYIIAGQFADEGLLRRAQDAYSPPVVIRETSFQDFIKDCATGA
jgi:NAD-dependent DNA ligase